jgi:NitT/TauT family transport system substrate-binding protein
MDAVMAFDNLIDRQIEHDRLVFSLTNLMNAPEAGAPRSGRR